MATQTSISVRALDELGHRVRVGPGDPSTADVLYYAALLIESEGWNNLRTSGTESSRNAGWSIHDAIGEACRRLSDTQGGGGSYGSKDATYTSSSGTAASLRTPAQAAVDDELQRMVDAGEWARPTSSAGRIDYDFNDAATKQDEVLAVLHRARAAV